jgi:hypothetical protein
VEQPQAWRQQEPQARRQVLLGLQKQALWREQLVQRVCQERFSFPIEPSRRE